jgi:NDP-sugar pyrophosphorylase family protein
MIDLARMASFHAESRALATIAVQNRTTSRYLLFDGEGRLCGRRAGQNGAPELMRAVPRPTALAFAGIHVISPRIFPLLNEEGAFPIIPAYLRLAGTGESIAAFRDDGAYWRDLGRPQSLREAERDIADGSYAI